MKNTCKKIAYTVATVSLLASLTAEARPRISYDYVGAQFFEQDLDDFDCDQDGLAIGGSKSLNNDLFVLGSYADASGDECGSGNLQLGLGYHTLFGADSSMYGALSFEDVSADRGEDDTGIIVAAGLRGFLTNELEAKIELAHHTVYDGNTQVNGGVAYWFNTQFAATADLSLGSEATSIAVGLRMNF